MDHTYSRNETALVFMMNSYFIASTPNVPLWFSAWIPHSAGATVGACVGLSFLTMGVKLLGALRHQIQLAWSEPTETRWHDSGFPIKTKVNKNEDPIRFGPFKLTNPSVAWSIEQDLPRGILAGIHTGLQYFLMLAVMTFNVYYLVAIVVGHSAGEAILGRWSTI